MTKQLVDGELMINRVVCFVVEDAIEILNAIHTNDFGGVEKVNAHCAKKLGLQESYINTIHCQLSVLGLVTAKPVKPDKALMVLTETGLNYLNRYKGS